MPKLPNQHFKKQVNILQTVSAEYKLKWVPTAIHLNLLHISRNEESDIPFSIYHKLITKISLNSI